MPMTFFWLSMDLPYDLLSFNNRLTFLITIRLKTDLDHYNYYNITTKTTILQLLQLLQL